MRLVIYREPHSTTLFPPPYVVGGKQMNALLTEITSARAAVRFESHIDDPSCKQSTSVKLQLPPSHEAVCRTINQEAINSNDFHCTSPNGIPSFISLIPTSIPRVHKFSFLANSPSSPSTSNFVPTSKCQYNYFWPQQNAFPSQAPWSPGDAAFTSKLGGAG